MAAALQVVQSASAAEKLLKPERLRMLELLRGPDSASGIARRLELPRQTVNYHLRELEREGFVEFVENRRKGNCLERVMRATARSYVISPAALGSLGKDAAEVSNQFSAAYLVGACARTIRDVSLLTERSCKAGKAIATLSMETEVRFASARDRQAFTEELLNAVARLVTKYNDDKAQAGRSFRLVVSAHPTVKNQEPAMEGSVRLE